MGTPADGTKGDETTKDPAAGAAGEGAGAAPQQPPAGAAAPPQQPPASAKGKADDDEEAEPKPDDKGMVSMPLSKFIKRLSRMSNKRLREVFGTDDVAQIAADRKELDDHRKDKADREKAAMSEKERREAELKEERGKREAAEARAQEVEDRAEARETQRDLRDLALEHVDKEDVDYLLDKMAAHVRRNPGSIEDAADAKEWVEEFVKKNPKVAKAAPDAGKAKDDKPKDKKPLDTGAKAADKKTPPPSGGESGAERTARPGQPGTMSKKEIQEKFGISY